MKSKYFKIVEVDKDKLQHLIDIEPKISKYLDLSSPFYFRITPDHYCCFVHTIISQQLASAAVDSIWNRCVDRLGKITPKTITNASLDTLRSIGFSENKIKCLKQVSYDVLDKKLSFKKLEKYSDNQILDILTKYHNIGKWTVENLLIFSYYRNNILPIDDFGIKKGLKIFYGVDHINQNLINKVIKQFNGYLTLFSLVMWKISNEN